MNRDDILKEFSITEVAQVTIPAEDMADEIVRLRRILDALRAELEELRGLEWLQPHTQENA